MPSCAAPCATKVATSKARTRISSMSGRSVLKRSARELSSAKAGSGRIPARASSGNASDRMRPFGTARITGSGMAAPDSDHGPFRQGRRGICPSSASLSGLAGRARLDGQRMDALDQQFGERLVDQPLARHAVQPFEGGGCDFHREVAFAARIMADMAAMLLAVVADDEP